MKEQIKGEDIRRFKRDNLVYTVFLVGMVLLPMPLLKFFREVGILLWLLWSAVAMIWAFRVEKNMKTHDIHTYKEIVAFLEGRRLDELEKQQENGKRHYQKFVIVLAVTVTALGIVLVLKKVLFGF